MEVSLAEAVGAAMLHPIQSVLFAVKENSLSPIHGGALPNPLQAVVNFCFLLVSKFQKGGHQALLRLGQVCALEVEVDQRLSEDAVVVLFLAHDEGLENILELHVLGA